MFYPFISQFDVVLDNKYLLMDIFYLFIAIIC